MKIMSAVEFRNRPMEVKVFDLCADCKTLKQHVEPREVRSYWPSFTLKRTCCAECWETAKRNAAAEAEGLIVC